jgi:hypothetical protein
VYTATVGGGDEADETAATEGSSDASSEQTDRAPPEEE